MIGIGLVLWCRALFFIFKGKPSYNQLKTFYRQLMPNFYNFLQILNGAANLT
jgi:hypothetical protein